MKTSQAGLDLIAEFEGFRADQYRDPVGVPTIGYGTTRADVNPLPAHTTREQALGWLKDNLARKYEPAINGLGVPLTQNQFDALVSFVYNVGPGGVAPSTGIGRALRARNYPQAADELLRWDKAGGKPLAGLTRRRQAERRVFLSGGAGAPPAASQGTPGGMGVAALPDGRLAVFVELESGEVMSRSNAPAGGWGAWYSLGTPGLG